MTRFFAIIAFMFILFTTSVGYAQAPDKATALATGFESGTYEISNYNTACYFSLAGNIRSWKRR